MYKYTQNNLIKNPIKYQYSDVSDTNFIEDYIVQRKTFLKQILNSTTSKFYIFLSTIQPLKHSEVLELQKKFEVKKVFFENERDNISFLTLFAFYLVLDLEQEFCFSLFSTLLKVNDSLTSINIKNFSVFEISVLEGSLKAEEYYFERIYYV